MTQMKHETHWFKLWLQSQFLNLTTKIYVRKYILGGGGGGEGYDIFGGRLECIEGKVNSTF